MNRFWLGAGTLWSREMVRFYRQPSRVMGALGSPLVFWLLLGSGIGTSFKAGAQFSSYRQYFFPGTLLLTIFFTAVFTTISIIEDRREGFLQAVLVSPVPRAGLVVGKVLGGSTLAFLQAFILLLLAPLVGIPLSFGIFLQTSVVLFITAFFFTALGFCLAWQFDSIQGFHAVMNLILMPMWMLSGALFPPEGASGWIQAVMKLNPLTYGMTAIRLSFFGISEPSRFWTSFFLTLLFGAAAAGASTLTVLRPNARTLG